MKTLTTQSILVLLTRDQQLELFDALENELEDTLNNRERSISQKLRELEEKYFDLVWLARSHPDERADIKICFDKVSAKYPGELEKLQSEEEGDWTHGFNSGILACSRLISSYILPRNYRYVIDSEINDEGEDVDITLTRDLEIDQAEEEFPFLDT